MSNSVEYLPPARLRGSTLQRFRAHLTKRKLTTMPVNWKRRRKLQQQRRPRRQKPRPRRSFGAWCRVYARNHDAGPVYHFCGWYSRLSNAPDDVPLVNDLVAFLTGNDVVESMHNAGLKAYDLYCNDTQASSAPR